MTWTLEAAEHAKRVFPEESCGLLVKIDGEEQYWECKNISPEPEDVFIINPDDWVEAEDISDEIIAVVHSHPKGSADPSELDKESCERFRWPFYIFSVEKNEWHYLEPERYIACPRLKESTNTDPNLRTIRLYGRLAREIGWKTLHADVTNTASVLAFLNANWPNIPYPEISQYYQIQIGEEYINDKLLDLEVEGDIRIVPIVSGSFFGVIWGAITGIASWYAGLQPIYQTVVLAVTMTAVEYGVQKAIEWLSPAPDEDPDREDPNTAFSGIQNVSRSGVPVPLLYGDVFTGSNVLSAKVHSAIEMRPRLAGQATYLDDPETKELVDRIGRTKGDFHHGNSIVMGAISEPQILELIELWGEGEIEGFPSAAEITNKLEYDRAALKDVYFDEVPVLKERAVPPYNVETDYNIKEVSFISRLGTIDQDPLTEAINTSRIRAFNAPVNKTENQNPTAVVKNIENRDANELLIQLTWPQGMSEGVAFQIIVIMDTGEEISAFPYHHAYGHWSNDWANDGSGNLRRPEHTYINENGKVDEKADGGAIELHMPSRSIITVDFRINLDEYRNLKDTENNDVGAEATQIKIQKLTNDNYRDWMSSFNLTAITEIINKTPNYYYSAYGKLKITSDAYKQIPRRMYHLRGTKIKIPAPYTSGGTTYTPTIDSNNGRVVYPDGYVFSGTLTTTKHWCSDPAWILYDLLTNTRTIPASLVNEKSEGSYDYGLGQNINENIIDKYNLFECSKYASELVHGEPRFSCNVVIKERKQVYTLINDICSCMRAMPYYASGLLQLSIDKPNESVYLFNRSNVGESGFSYTGSTSEDRFTVINVSYFDIDTKKRDIITVEASQSLLNKYGYQVKDLKSFACNSKEQARRLGLWFLETQHNEGETVSFSSSLHSGVLVRPGQVISISDPLRAGVRLGGRISSVSSTTVFAIDSVDTAEVPVNGDEISVLLPTAATTTGSNVPYGKVETKTITNVDTTTITVGAAFSEAPAVGAPWVVSKADHKPIKYRVVAVSEGETLEYVISAIRYDENKYAAIEASTGESDG